MKRSKIEYREIQPGYIRCSEDENSFSGVLGRREYETVAYKIVAVSKRAEQWIPLRLHHFSLDEMWALDEMIQSGFLQYHGQEDNFTLTRRALLLIMEEYSGLH